MERKYAKFVESQEAIHLYTCETEGCGYKFGVDDTSFIKANEVHFDCPKCKKAIGVQDPKPQAIAE